MERNWDLAKVSDGKLYESNDLVKVGCNGCKDCSACCHGMGNSIVLDPFDFYRLTLGLDKTPEELLDSALELNTVDGLALPNLKMQGENEACFFLNEEGWCSIHSYRPGICRIFPLGRIYQKDQFRYFIQIHECKAAHKTKIKIKNWIDTNDIEKNDAFILDWHYFLKNYQEQIKAGILKGAEWKQVNLRILQCFYLTPYDRDTTFYLQYEKRRKLWL